MTNSKLSDVQEQGMMGQHDQEGLHIATAVGAC